MKGGMEMDDYKDMLDMEVPEPPEGRVRMSLHDRAAQFSPFAALVGFEEEIDAARIASEQNT